MAAGELAVGNPVLRLAQQHIAALFPDCAGQKLAARAEKAQVNAQPGAFAHQGRAGPGIAEADDALQRVQRNAGQLRLGAVYHHGFAVQREIGILGQNVQGVQQLSHTVSPKGSSRCSRR